MKQLIYGTLCLFLFAGLLSCANKNAQTETFKVWGNCEMCKKTIEGSLQYDGVIKANWNVDAKTMTVEYDTTKTNIDEIQKKISAAGYDTETYTGDSTAYTQLHECCQYERKNN